MEAKTITVKNWMGRAIYPFNLEVDNPEYPCPELSDSKGEVVEAVLVWRYYDVVCDCWREDEIASEFKGCDIEQIYRLVPKEEKVQLPENWYQPLFNLMSGHGLTLLQSEMNEIVDCVKLMLKN